MKRILSLVLTVLLLVGIMCIVPVNASAADTATVYFVDFCNNYKTAYAYAWSTDEDGNVTYDTAWPGKEMTATGEAMSDGGLVYSCEFDQEYDNIIFINGATEQTKDLTFETGKYLWWGNEEWYDSLEALGEHSYFDEYVDEETATSDEETATTTVYFVDYYDNFETVYAYAWSTDEDGNDTYDTAWPGKEMTATGEVMSDGGLVYSCEFDQEYDYIIFSDGTNDKTEDLTFEAGKYLWWGDELWYDSLEELGEHGYFDDSDDGEYLTIYFQNNWMWTDVSIYYWGSDEDPEWPGYEMNFINNDGTYDIYSYDVPVDVTGIIINGIKNDGTGELDKTPDITDGICENICYYMIWDDESGNQVGSEDICTILPSINYATLKGYSLSLEGNIGVSFYFDFSSSIYDDADAVVRFTVPNTGKTTTLDIPVNEGEWDSATGYYKYTCYVAAKELTSVIKAQVITEVLDTEEHEYTIKQYAEYMLEHSDIYANEQDIVKSLLNYGAASQVYFDYNLDDLANDTEFMTDDDRVIAYSNVSYWKPVIDGEPGTIEFYGASLVLKSETSLKFYFRIDNPPYENMGINVNGLTAELTKNGDLYELKISDIPIRELSNTYTLKTGDQTITYGVFSYVYLAQQSSDEDLVNVVNALMGYYRAVGMYGCQ